MSPQMNDLRQSLRNLKNDILYHYYDFRINTPQYPYQIAFRRTPYRILFILSHMRSGSSLLTHILNSNPEIIGYGETHIEYSSEQDLKKLIYKIYCKNRSFEMNHKYVLDKVLHNRKFTDISFLLSDSIYNIFLLRSPQRSLASMLDIKPHWSEQEACSYYINRLERLSNYAKILNDKNHNLFIQYDSLIDNTQAVFTALKEFLGTTEGFSENYQVLKTTGMRGIGDSSPNIKAGKIIRKPRQLEHQISPDLVKKSLQAFDRCSDTLSQYCKTVDFSI